MIIVIFKIELNSFFFIGLKKRKKLPFYLFHLQGLVKIYIISVSVSNNRDERLDLKEEIEKIY
jgi:hypothetical protein